MFAADTVLWSCLAAVALARGVHARLPGDTVPESYELTVAPDVSAESGASFAGQVNIAIAAKKTTSSITLHSKRLVVHEVAVTDVMTNRRVRVDGWTYDRDAERVTVSVGEHVLANRKYTVRLRFEGRLSDGATGFFKSFYTTRSDEKKWFAATQFYATHARSVFPCYDEPAFKTYFKISIRRKPNEIALSNMPILNTIDVVEKVAGDSSAYQNWTWVHFMRTPPISTFSVAFFVGDFEQITCDDCQDVTNVYSHLGSLYQIDYITRAAPSLLNALETYTSVTYSLPKLDLLAVPGLSTKVVDSWGLSAYGEQSVFVDKNTQSKHVVSAKMTAERVMAHQWFGNLVTPEWWNFAWLNEGFATYFEYFATATVEPDWCLNDFFVVERLQSVMEYDQSTVKQHPLSASLSVPGDDVYDVFDRITGNKGAAVLRMLRDWVGEESFKSALNLYLTTNRFKAVKPEQLWNAFDTVLFENEESDSTNSSLLSKSAHKIMNTWTERAGYPVVLVTKRDKSLVLTQERFSVNDTDANDNTKWFIRLSYTTDADADFDIQSAPFVWLDPSTENGTADVPVADDVGWYIFNVQSTVICRVNYPEENWLSLIRQLNKSPAAVHVVNRAQLIDDSFNLARAGWLDYAVPLAVARCLENERDVVPWFSAMNGLGYVLDRMRRCERGHADVKAFVSRLAGIAFRTVDKLVAEKRNQPQHPINIGWNAFSMWACKLNNDDCTRTTLGYYRRWLNGEEIPADIKDATFCTAIRHGRVGEGIWEKMLNLYITTRTYSEKESALNALACTEDVQLLTTLLELILEDKCPIEKHDYNAFFVSLSSTSSGVTALTSFLRNHFTTIIDHVDNGKNMVFTIYSILSSKVSTDQEITKMWEIAIATTMPVEIRNKLTAIYHGEIENNQKWFDRYSIAIREIINPGSTNISTTTPAITTQDPSKDSSSAPSIFHNYVTILQILAMSLSIKFFVNTN